jgi:predicted anti-sigma-YlaC factor YlaD
MNCRETVEFLRHYLDDELPEQVKACFDMHLSVCPSCVDFMNSYRRTIELAKSAGTSEPATNCETIPEELVKAILAARHQCET